MMAKTINLILLVLLSCAPEAGSAMELEPDPGTAGVMMDFRLRMGSPPLNSVAEMACTVIVPGASYVSKIEVTRMRDGVSQVVAVDNKWAAVKPGPIGRDFKLAGSVVGDSNRAVVTLSFMYDEPVKFSGSYKCECRYIYEYYYFYETHRFLEMTPTAMTDSLYHSYG